MLGFLFRRLTAEPARGAALFAALTDEARQPHWYVEGEVPDTLDGRFAVLATLTALALVRLEATAETGERRVGRADRTVHRCHGKRASRARARRPDAGQDRAQAGRHARAADRAVARGRRGGGDWADATRESLYQATSRGRRRCSHSARGAAAPCGAPRGDAARPSSSRGRFDERPLRPPAPARPDPRRRAARPRRRRSRAHARSPSGWGCLARPARGACRRSAAPAPWSAPKAGSPPRSSRAASSPAIRLPRMSTSRSPSLFMPEPPERRARRGDRARRSGLRRGLPRRRDDRPWRRDRRHAGAQPRSLSAQRGRRGGAQGSGRADARSRRARSRCSPS